MGQMSIRLPRELQDRMREVPLNWSEVVRQAIEERLAQVERERALRAWTERDEPDCPVAPGTAARLVREDRDA